MEIRQTLVDISNDARGWLNVWIKDFSDDEATRRVDHDGPNPLAWQLGHLAGVEDDVYQLFSGKPSIVPPALKAACRTGSPAPSSATTFPPYRSCVPCSTVPTPPSSGCWRTPRRPISTGPRWWRTSSSALWDSRCMRQRSMRTTM